MRAILLILILAIVAVIAALGTGMIDFDMTRGARAPDVDATGNGVVAKGGQAPAFDVETGSVQVGVAPTNVTLPRIQIQPVGNDSQQQPPPPGPPNAPPQPQPPAQ